MTESEANARPKNAIVILLDSFNRHLLGAYGGGEFDTPNSTVCNAKIDKDGLSTCAGFGHTAPGSHLPELRYGSRVTGRSSKRSIRQCAK